MRLAPALVALALAGCLSPAPPASETVTFDAIEIDTAHGVITAIVFCEETPETCGFMRDLVRSGYYDGRAFGRIIPGFVIQEVDRTGGTTDQPEQVVGEFGTDVMFSAGAFGIARDADPDSGGSEFFVMDHAISTLYGNYTAFAQVVDGMDVVHAIARVPAVKTGPASSVAASPPGSPVYFGVHDRVPIEPVEMRVVSWTSVELRADEAARYPLRVGETWRSDTHRSTLEWERTLAPGVQTPFTWYVATRDTSETAALGATDPPALSLDGAEITVTGAADAMIGSLQLDEQVGTVRFSWAPPAPGDYALTLTADGATLGVQNLTFG